MSATRESQPNEKWIIVRYTAVVFAILCLGAAIIANIIKIAFIEKETWLTIAARERNRVPDSKINPERGNIYSEDGYLMATSFPLYHVYIDFRGDAIDSTSFLQKIIPSRKNQPPTHNDTLKSKINSADSLSIYLAKKFNKDRKQIKDELLRAYKRKDRRYRITDARITYTDLKEIKTYPFLRLGKNKCGMITEDFIERKSPYLSLAARTIGNVYATLDTAGYSQGKNGLELYYNNELRGQPGLKARRKIGGRWMDIPIRKAIKGMDIVTTINIDIQHITEKALKNIMHQTQAYSGSAIVMEVKTGEIKAISNMGRTATGDYTEKTNYAVADQIEPGSTFKTASIMVALDDGICTPDDIVDTGNGAFLYKGRLITDHNKDKGGNHVITVAEAMYRSSNIGISKIIIKGYERNPKKFVDGISRLGLTEDLHLEIPGAGKPIIKTPSDKKWSPSDLPSMAYGYVTSIPPIYMLTFYNAIANNGRMVRPMFVKEIKSEGKTVRRFETETIRDNICNTTTLNIIKNMLLGVIENEHGTGKPAHSNTVRIAGKTGTALIGENGGYTGNGKQVSFAGYFPAENPQYSCIVVVRRPQTGVASGGGTGGKTVKEIAEAIYSAENPIDIRKMKPAQEINTLPQAKAGNMQSTKYVLNKLNVKTQRNNSKSEWIQASPNEGKIRLDAINMQDGQVPRVLGMGAKDAIYLLEASGLRVKLSGTGLVTSQSIPPGQKLIKNQTIILSLK